MDVVLCDVRVVSVLLISCLCCISSCLLHFSLIPSCRLIPLFSALEMGDGGELIVHIENSIAWWGTLDDFEKAVGMWVEEEEMRCIVKTGRYS